jgi:RNA polymerase sigma factor (TIGR02999 family)
VSDATRILAAIEKGDARAADELLSVVYEELRRLAGQKLARERRQTLQPTDLVHEAYLRLVGAEGKEASSQGWDNRGHFFAAAAEAMRRILIDRARRRQRIKHGGGREKLELDTAIASVEEPPADLIALDEALTLLASEDRVKADLVKLRYFAGLKIEEAASIMGISRATADRYWAFAKAWLYHEITKGDTTSS